MIKRIPVTDKHVEVAVTILMSALSRKIQKHGAGAYVSKHECLGFMAEEYKELVDAVHANDADGVTNEMLDCATVGLWSVASMVAGSEAAKAAEAKVGAKKEVIKTDDGIEKTPFIL